MSPHYVMQFGSPTLNITYCQYLLSVKVATKAGRDATTSRDSVDAKRSDEALADRNNTTDNRAIGGEYSK